MVVGSSPVAVALLLHFLTSEFNVDDVQKVISTGWSRFLVTDSCRMEKMHGIAQQAKYRFVGIDEVYKIGDE